MRHVGRILAYIFLFLNAVVAGLLIVSAYSPYFNPHVHPIWSSAGLLFPLFLLANFLFLCFWLIVWPRCAFFPLLIFVCCWGSIRSYLPINLFQDEKTEESIKVLSYNTCAFGNLEPHTKETPNKVLSYLQKSDADIICLQEYILGGRLKKKDVDYALRDYPYRHYYSFAKGLNGLGCYSKYPILSSKPIIYKSESNASIAYQIKVGNDTLLVVNNHLESNRIGATEVDTYKEVIDAKDSKKVYTGLWQLLKKMAGAVTVRAGQAEMVSQTIKESPKEKIIVCGDFNDTPVSYTHRVMGDGLKDAFVESGNGLGVSYNKHRMYFRIDYILLSKNLKSFECTVDDTIDASDHYPIWCYISLN